MATTYDLFFGTNAAGLAPAFDTFKNDATDAALAAPVLTDKGGGFYRFTVDWGALGATAIRFSVKLDGYPDQGDILFPPGSAGASGGSIVAVPSTQNLNLFDTAGTIVSRALVQLGVMGPIADPYASTDPNVIQACEFLRQAGDDLNTEHDWTHLIRQATFVTDGVSLSYAFPPDFHELVDQTLWNRSTRLPGMGPLSPQQVAVLQARLVNVILNVTYQIQGGLLVWPIVPAAGATIAFSYVSTFWVQSAAGASPDKDQPSASSDVVLYDPDLMIAALKLRYCEEKGIGDVVACRARYDQKLEHCIGKNDPGPILSLGRGTSNPVDRMLDGRNVPEGSW